MSKSALDRYHDTRLDDMNGDELSKWMRRITDGYKPDLPARVEWYGQPHLIAQITPFLNSGLGFPHTLILGEPGLGKTHLAMWIASNRGEPFEELLAPVDPGNLPMSGVALIDEIHMQRKPEPLFQAMKETEPTIIGATTRPELVDKAFRSRFFLELYLERYTSKEMHDLIGAELETTEECLDVLSTAAAGNPRQAKRLAEVARRLDTTNPADILDACQITVDGLTGLHLRYLETLADASRPMGLTQLSTVMYADETTVRGLEPLLIDYNLINLNSNGRSLTRKGASYARGLS